MNNFASLQILGKKKLRMRPFLLNKEKREGENIALPLIL